MRRLTKNQKARFITREALCLDKMPDAFHGRVRELMRRSLETVNYLYGVAIRAAVKRGAV